MSINRQISKASANCASLVTIAMCLPRLAAFRFVYTPAPRCTRPLHAVKRPLYTPAPRCQTSAVGLHASSTLSNFRCKRPLHAVVHSLYTPARCRTRPLAVVHSLHTPAPCRTFTAHGRSYTPVPCCRLLVVTAPLAGPPCLPSASSSILLCTLRMPLPDTSLADLCVYLERRVRSLHSLCIYVRRQTTDRQ